MAEGQAAEVGLKYWPTGVNANTSNVESKLFV